MLSHGTTGDWSGSLTPFFGKIVEQSSLKPCLTKCSNNKVIWNRQQGFTKGKSHLTNLMAFYDELTDSVDKGTVKIVVYL